MIWIITFTLGFWSLTQGLEHITCSGWRIREMSKIFQGFRSRSRGCEVLTNTYWTEDRIQQFSLPESTIIFSLKQRRHSAGVSSLPLCLFNIIRVCVCLCLLYVCPALCHCLFVYSVTWGRVCWSWSCGSGGNRFSWAGTTGCPGWHHLNTRRHGYVRAPGGAPCYSASGPAWASLTFPK